MAHAARFQAAYPYQSNVLALPVADVDAAAAWYCPCFGMTAVDRSPGPVPTVILERDGIRIGFAVNGADPSQDGAAIRVAGVEALRAELQARGVPVGGLSMDEHEGQKRRAFFVAAPDGLCYYFYEPISESGPSR